MMGYNYRGRPVGFRIKRFYEKGAIQEIKSISCSSLSCNKCNHLVFLPFCVKYIIYSYVKM
jgi:hypothetical protein